MPLTLNQFFSIAGAGFLAALLLPALRGAPKFDGQWVFQIGSNTKTRMTLDATADGDKFTGKLASSKGEEDLRDGKLTADGVSFTVADGGQDWNWTCRTIEDALHCTRERDNGKGRQHLTGKRNP